jgi:hypothetical protein
MACVSDSVKPLAMRSITVVGFCPERNAAMAAMISAALRPAIRGTFVSTFALLEWQPVHDAAPGGGIEGAAATPAEGENKQNVATTSTAAIPPPASAASGEEGGDPGLGPGEPGGGSFFVFSADVQTQAPPTPDPSPPFAARMGGGEPRERCMSKKGERRS